jgi:transposase
MNPTERESAGKASGYTPISKQGRSSLRWCLWPAAITLLRHNPDFKAWAKARQERPVNSNPLHRREVIGAAINKILRLVFSLVKNHSTYQLPQPIVSNCTN